MALWDAEDGVELKGLVMKETGPQEGQPQMLNANRQTLFLLISRARLTPEKANAAKFEGF